MPSPLGVWLLTASPRFESARRFQTKKGCMFHKTTRITYVEQLSNKNAVWPKATTSVGLDMRCCCVCVDACSLRYIPVTRLPRTLSQCSRASTKPYTLVSNWHARHAHFDSIPTHWDKNLSNEQNQTSQLAFISKVGEVTLPYKVCFFRRSMKH